MAYVDKDGLREEYQVVDYDHICFYCGKVLVPPLILWYGRSDIYLHPECCRRLIIRLGVDVWRWECDPKLGGRG